MFVYDLNTKKVTNECNLNPTEVKKSEMYWLWARNNKYSDNGYDFEKVGKWMLFVRKDQVDAVWNKIKEAVSNGDLFSSKVSTTSEPYDPNESHAIMIYTQDHTDLNDVIDVLNFLQSSGISPPEITIRYKTDAQTRSGIYSGGRQRPWIYASDTIRGKMHQNWRSRDHGDVYRTS